jgi:cytoskeletal protein CcmA (bactofilin family)
MENQEQAKVEDSSLEGSSSTTTPDNQQITEATSEEEATDALEKPEAARQTSSSADRSPTNPKKPKAIKVFLSKFNIYLSLFGLIIFIAIIIITIAYFQSKKASSSTIKSQGLSSSTLQQLSNSDATVGGPQQVLNVESNAVFAGKVLIRDSLEVAGGLQVSGTVSFQNITVTGSTNLQQAAVAQALTVGGTLNVQGAGTFNQGIQVNGSGTFSGAITTPQLTTPNFQLNGDLTLAHHFIVGGPSPSSSSGNALGSGGTTSIGGSDTAGAVSVNTGGGPTAGCFITVNFSSGYKQIPYVMVTPVGQSAGGLAYYITRTEKSFSICTASAAPANSSFGFNYFVVD